MKRIVLLVLALNVVVACAVRAQELPAVPPAAAASQTPPPQTQPPVPPAPVPPSPESKVPVTAPSVPAPAIPAPLSDDAIRRRRDRLSIMEGVLTGAVRGAAQQIARRMATQDVGPFVLSGALTARGFILEGYGVFFHVEIPGVDPVVVPIEAMVRQRSAQRSAGPERTAAGESRTAAAPIPAESDAEYVEVVKRALIEAMIENSKSLELQPQEWLTVAAADGQEPSLPTPYLVERATLVLRIRGSDISDYMAGRLTLAEVSKKVEVRKF